MLAASLALEREEKGKDGWCMHEQLSSGAQARPGTGTRAELCTCETSRVANRTRRQRSSILETAGQPSRRTVSMPFASNVPTTWPGDSYIMPTYRFLVCSTHGWYTCSRMPRLMARVAQIFCCTRPLQPMCFSPLSPNPQLMRWPSVSYERVTIVKAAA